MCLIVGWNNKGFVSKFFLWNSFFFEIQTFFLNSRFSKNFNFFEFWKFLAKSNRFSWEKNLKLSKDSNDPASVLTRSDTNRSRFYDRSSFFVATVLFMEDAIFINSTVVIFFCTNRYKINKLCNFIWNNFRCSLSNSKSTNHICGWSLAKYL